MRSPLSTLCACLLASTPLAGLAGPARAAEPEPGPPIELGAEIWRLRPSQSTMPAQPARSLGARPAGEIPETRRNVRVVYPALVEAR